MKIPKKKAALQAASIKQLMLNANYHQHFRLSNKKQTFFSKNRRTGIKPANGVRGLC